jgi:hypothetical protein
MLNCAGVRTATRNPEMLYAFASEFKRFQTDLKSALAQCRFALNITFAFDHPRRAV